MPMLKGDAVYIDVVLRWMTGDQEITTEHAYAAGRELAERVRRVLGAGVRPITVLQCERFADRPHAAHQLLAGLLAECWEYEQSDGSWPGPEVVDMVIRELTARGYDITHPDSSAGRTDWPPNLLRGIALTRARDATANAVTHAEPDTADRGMPERYIPGLAPEVDAP